MVSREGWSVARVYDITWFDFFMVGGVGGK